MVYLLFLVLPACAQSGKRTDTVENENFRLSSLAKTDLGEVIEVHLDQSHSYLRELMTKLYKRNPRELLKSTYAGTMEENIVRLFDLKHEWNFPEFGEQRGGEVINLAFSEEYQGDRVFCLVAGLLYMHMQTYNHKRNFYLLQSPDPQNVYNLARNIEITVWKLENKYDRNGELFLYTNSLADEDTNLSYERLFGKLIGLQDTLALIIARKTNRSITRVFQQMATAVFLPVF